MTAPPDTASRIARCLRRKESLLLLKTGLMLLFGVPLTLIGPALLATIFWFAYIQWGKWVPWSWFFWGFVLILVPLLFRLEVKSAGDYLGKATKDLKTEGASVPALLLNFGDVAAVASVLYNPRAMVAGFTDIFLFGPRLVVSAWRQLRLRALVRSAKPTRTTAVIETLFASDHAVPTQSLLQPGEQQQELSAVLGYLLLFDWIGVAHDASKVWLLTEARQLLAPPAP